MGSLKLEKERGQILVQVAFMVVALLAFVALALDGGQIYAGRRRMQNAADAGALAGARAICFDGVSEEEAMDVAREYAVDRNESQGADVDVLGGYTVTVATSQTLNTFFAGVINIDTVHVQAEAEAVCGPLVSGVGTWPIAFDFTTFTDVITCGQQFLLFDDENVFDLDCAAGDCDCEPGDCEESEDDDCCDRCNCGIYGPHLGPGQYNWVNFDNFDDDVYDRPSDPMCKNPGGASWAECWIRYGYPAPVNEGDCILRESGIKESVLKAVNDFQLEYRNIILYEETCTGEEVPKPGGEYYKVAALGCIQVIEYDSSYNVPTCDDPSARCDNRWHKVIKAKRVCPGIEGFENCRSYTGSGVAEGSSESWGVSLSK